MRLVGHARETLWAKLASRSHIAYSSHDVCFNVRIFQRTKVKTATHFLPRESSRESLSRSRMLSLPSFSSTHVPSCSSASLVPLPLKRRPGRQPIGEEPEVTQPRAQRSPGNGAPNFKGLPPGRKRTESGDTSAGGSTTAIKCYGSRLFLRGGLERPSLPRGTEDASGRREPREF